MLEVFEDGDEQTFTLLRANTEILLGVLNCLFRARENLFL